MPDTQSADAWGARLRFRAPRAALHAGPMNLKRKAAHSSIMEAKMPVLGNRSYSMFKGSSCFMSHKESSRFKMPIKRAIVTARMKQLIKKSPQTQSRLRLSRYASLLPKKKRVGKAPNAQPIPRTKGGPSGYRGALKELWVSLRL